MEVGKLTIPVGVNLGPVTTDLNRLNERLRSAEKQTSGVTNSMKGMERQTKALSGVITSFARQLAGVFAVRELINFTDTWTDLTSRVNLAAGSIERGAAVMDQLQVIARRTYSSLDQTVESYIRNAQTLRDLGRSTQQTLDYTEALNNALVVSGARADRAASVQDALGKAMASGRLSGINLNTVIERGGRVAELLAEELGTTVSGLRKLGAEGKITGDVIDRALVGNMRKLREEADSMPATIGDAFQLLGNALLQTIGLFDTAVGASSTLAEALIWVADNMERVLTYVASGAAMWGLYSAGVVAVNAGLFTFNGLLALTKRALITSGIGIAIVAVGELAYRFVQLVKSTGGVGEAFSLLGDVAKGVWEGITISAKAIPPGLESVWADIQAQFILMIGQLKGAWNEFISFFAQPALVFNVGGKSYELIGGIDTSQWEFDLDQVSDSAARFQSRAAELRETSEALAKQGFEKVTDSLRELGDAIKDVESSVDLSDDGGPNRVLTELDKNARKLQEAYKNITDGAREFIAEQELEMRTIGMSTVEANKLRYTFDLLNQATRAGIKLTPEYAEELANLAAQMAEAEAATDRVREAYEFNKGVFKGFFSDLKSELQNGASIWEAFGNAAANALQKIADKALDMALNGIFDMIFGAFGGGGGFLGTGGLLSFFADGTSFAPGGWSVVGERGPELMKLPAGTQVRSNNRITAPSHPSFGGGAGGGSPRIALEVFVKDDGKIGAIARQEAGSVVEVAIHDYNTNVLPDRIEGISNHPRLRR